MASLALCERCADFDLKASLRYYDPSATQVLLLGPFAEPIETTKCELCKLARHAVGCQDALVHSLWSGWCVGAGVGAHISALLRILSRTGT
jgi:hypothetical protein